MIAFFSLVRDDLNAAGASGAIRSMNTARILQRNPRSLDQKKSDRGVQQVKNIDAEHLIGMIESSLMDQFALQVDGRAFRILEGDFETLATKQVQTH